MYIVRKLDLTWVDEDLQVEVLRTADYTAGDPNDRYCEHQRVLVAVGGSEERVQWVDVGLAPIFRWAWRADINVMFGCEGATAQRPWAELEFMTPTISSTS